MIFTWGHALSCWNSFATYILAVFDPSSFNLGEKSGVSSVPVVHSKNLSMVKEINHYLVLTVNS
ncbi:MULTISPECIES: hypothetical protein, partial [Nostoc]|uniref:hypothetical protein n=1 Tax=Nostoc TaxID=1177 RepID=UPI001A7E3F77